MADSGEDSGLGARDSVFVCPRLGICGRHRSPVTRHGARCAPRALRAHGFTYIGLLIVIALMGIGLAGAGTVWHTESRRAKERELLFAGDQIRRAIGLYYERTPGTKQFPQTLEDLLLDRRYPNTQRYLRRIYHDPLTGEVEWGLVRGPQGGIVGVHSLSEARPFKQAGFRQIYEDFEGAERYLDWKFVYRPPETQNPDSTAAAPAAGNTN